MSLPLWRRTAAVLRAALPQLALYDLVFKLLGLIILAPLTAWALDGLIGLSGQLAVTNAAVAGYLMSPAGIGFLLATGTLTLTSLFAEQAGLMRLAAAADSGRRDHWLAALIGTARALPGLLRTALAQTALILAGGMPLAAAAGLGYRLLLSTHDINWYLTETPPAFWAAVALGAVIAVTGAVLLALALVRWALAVPVTVLEGRAGLAALRRSRELVAGNRVRVAMQVLGWVGLCLAAAALVLWGMRTLGVWLYGVFQSDDARILLVALGLGLVTLTGLLLSFLAYAGYAFIVSRLYRDLAAGQTIAEPIRVAQPAPTAAGIAVAPRALAALLLAAVGLSALLTHAILDDLRLGRDTQVTAHRGSSAQAPENSLSAIRQAIAEGADYAEIDVQQTADGILVLLHDSDLMRVAGIPRAIWELDYAELEGVDAGSWFSPEFAGEPIATLEQAMALAGERIRLNIELKYNGHERDLAARVARTVRDAGFGGRCIITSLDAAGLAEVRRIAPELTVGQIVTVAIGDPKRLDVDLLSMEASRATAAAVRANRAAGLATHVWTVNDPRQMQRMLERGVDNIITDRPAELRRLIDARGERSDVELLLLALAHAVMG